MAHSLRRLHTHSSHVFNNTEADHSPGAFPLPLCDGTPVWRTYGTRLGHNGPGTVFLIWGAWWMIAFIWRYNRDGRRYRAASWYRFVWPLALLEPLVKTLGPMLMMWIELKGDHARFRTLTCAAGDVRGGKFALTHMNNWTHASMYPAFILSGLTDLIGVWVELPSGIGHATMALAFGLVAFLLGFHEKHNPLDQAVHTLQAWSSALCMIAVLVEAAVPRSAVPAGAKSAAMLVQGAWLVEIANIMWTDDPRWDVEDMGSHMMVPIYFTWTICAVAFLMMAVFVATTAAYRFFVPAYDALPDSDFEAEDGKQKEGFGSRLSRDDSANESRNQSDCGTPTKERATAREGARGAEDRNSLEQRLEEGLARGGGGWRSFLSGVAPGASTFDVESGSGASCEHPRLAV